MIVFIEREFEVVGSDGAKTSLRIFFFKPTQSGQDWCCKTQIHDDGKVIEREAFGVDSMQAFRLAEIVMKAELEYYKDKYEGRITFVDQEDLWL